VPPEARRADGYDRCLACCQRDPNAGLALPHIVIDNDSPCLRVREEEAVSAFFANHPLPAHFIANTASIGLVLSAALAITTLIAILRADQQAWTLAGHSRRRWVVIAVAGLAVLPVAAVTSLVWRARIQPKLLAASSPPAGLPDPSRLFAAVTTFKGRAVRTAIAVIAMLSVADAASAINVWTVGDPDTVSITRLGHDVEPRSHITAACPTTVRKTLHLIDPGVQVNTMTTSAGVSCRGSVALVDCGSGRMGQ